MEMATRTKSAEALKLPKIGAAWPGVEGSAYAGVTTDAKGKLFALVLLADKPAGDIAWQPAMDWAKSISADLPTRPECALMFANIRKLFAKRWHWTSEVHADDASYAWLCHFFIGHQYDDHKSFEGCARAVRRFPIDPSILSVAGASRMLPEDAELLNGTAEALEGLGGQGVVDGLRDIARRIATSLVVAS
jgi:hypothetical protein